MSQAQSSGFQTNTVQGYPGYQVKLGIPTPFSFFKTCVPACAVPVVGASEGAEIETEYCLPLCKPPLWKI